MRILLLSGVFISAAYWMFACAGNNVVTNRNSAECQTITDTPAEAYKRLYAAVKARNTEEIKKVMSSGSIQFAAAAAQRQNNPVEKVFENGFTSTTMAAEMPEIRDERVKCNYGAVEVWNSKESRWEDLPFVIEDGSWKLAVGEMFAGTYKSPGKNRDQIEKEAANALRPPADAQPPFGNANTNTKVPRKEKVPVPPGK